ncbi:hypothetical protein GJ496_006429 [Pomphorhynchus laevis]|nr:hypothetical protein GJ496_006429 [Pomphorhynchus laevis]
MAFNGWTANNDALKSFADEDSHVYLRRELIVWNDLIKVRYGNCLDDCPALWKYMEQYTVNTAEVFKAVRLDNCHSTPLHVAEHMLDMARKVKSDLYIFGELFTGNEELDNIFVNKLGITSLVRESMSSYNAYDFGRQIYRYGGKSVGSFYHPPVRPIVAGVAHAIFYDITHDNMCPITTHSIYDILPRMFLTNMACCSTGSSRGYDELVPHHISVVTEERLYAKFTKDNKTTDPSTVNGNSGIIAARRVANKLHESLREEGFTQIYVDQVTTDIIAITRHNPSTHHSIVLVARTSFALPDNPEHTGYIRPLFIPGHIEEVIVEADLQRICEDSCNMLYTRNSKFINGLSESAFKLNMRCHVKLNDSQFVFISNNEYDKPDRNVEFKHFTPGCVIAFRVSLANNVKQAVFQIRKAASEFCSSESSDPSSFTSIVSRLSLSDLNRVLYRCSEEEMDDGYGSNVYNIPNYGELVYAGLQGFMSVMEKIRLSEDMGSPICENLRNGNWIMEYIVKRLKYHKDTLDLGLWFENVFENFKRLPRFLIPSYFDAVLTGAYTCIIDRAWSHMPSYIRNGSTLLKALSLVSVQLVGYTKSSLMPKLSPYLQKPVPEQYVDLETRKTYQLIPSLSAGLRHFSTGAFRNWGRDTFISLRGLLLLTGRHNEARFIILSYGQCLRHGLIPNLLGAGVGARYNCRDAYWWWLYSIKCYTESVDKGHEILKDACAMMYPTDESPACEPGSNRLLNDSTDKNLLGRSSLINKIKENSLHHPNVSLKFKSRCTSVIKFTNPRILPNNSTDNCLVESLCRRASENIGKSDVRVLFGFECSDKQFVQPYYASLRQLKDVHLAKMPHSSDRREGIESVLANNSFEIVISGDMTYLQCGVVCDNATAHGLDCRYSLSRHARHAEVSGTIRRTLMAADMPSRLEPMCLSRTDDKRIEGGTLVALKHEFNQHLAVHDAGLIAKDAAIRKYRKYVDLDPRKHMFTAIVIKTLEAVGSNSLDFQQEFGRRLDILLYEVIHMGLRRHIQKMKYRERGAGYNLDNDMSDKGFNVEIGVDINTGFVYGGTQYNCGTWMDKMGSSDKAGNRGIPATPRDGSAVEIVGLSKSCIDWLIEMGKNGYYPYSSIEYHYKGSKKVFKLKDWSNLISANFEKHFWIGEDETPSEKNKFYVNRTGIFKDCVNSSGGWTDYQLRPNFLITLVVAPSLCDVEHAWTAILAAEKNLMGFVGVKTLDPSDLNYVPDYDNSNDSCDKKVAHGWGYHQGPEWLWLTGYLYRAMLNFANLREQKHPGCLAESLVKTKTVIGRLHDLILNSEWKGLPELTNSNGGFCPFSCDTQAWSASSLLELMVHIGGIAK